MECSMKRRGGRREVEGVGLQLFGNASADLDS